MIDPFTLSTSVAGFISLALQVTELLHKYISSVASAKKDAQALITEIEALSVVLDKFVKFLRQEDVKGISFRDTSGLCPVIAICREQLQFLYKKLAKVAGTGITRLAWPFKAKDVSQYVQTLARCRGIFHFSLTIDNCKLMSKTNDEILTSLKTQQDSLSQVSKMMPMIPAEMSRLSDQIATILQFLPTLADASGEIHAILTGVQGLEQESKLELSCKNSVFPFISCSVLRYEKIVKILQWLSPLEPPKRHQDLRSIRVKGTGYWLLQEATFQNWRNYTGSNADRALCCYGIPGAGKTVITSLVIDYLAMQHVDGIVLGQNPTLTESQIDDEAVQQNPRVAYIYCDYRDRAQQTPVNLLGSLLRQVVATFPSVPDEIAQLHEKCHREGKSLELGDVESVFLRLCQSSEMNSLYVCVDALDECNDSDTFLKSLQKLLSHPSLKLFITGQPHVRARIEKFFGKALKITIEAHQDDVKKFISEKIEKDHDRDPDLMDEGLRTDILERIGVISQKMFLLPALQIREVLEERTKFDRRLALSRLPEELYTAFGRTLERIQQQPKAVSKEAMNILMWTHFAKRPLHVRELQQALAVRPGDIRLNIENLPSLKTWLDGCFGLVVIDDETSIIRLVHFSLQEYLHTRHKEIFPLGHTQIALTCLTCLHFDGFGDEKTHSTAFEFLDYASCQWGHHVRNETTVSEKLGQVMNLSVRLLQDKSKLRSIVGYLDRSGPYMFLEPLSGLHIASYFGIPVAVQALFECSEGAHADSKDNWGQTPLSWAAWNGHAAVVELLFSRGADADSKDDYDLTPLSWAAGNGHEAVVELLLSKEADADSKDDYGDTPLSRAAGNGHAAVVELLSV